MLEMKITKQTLTITTIIKRHSSVKNLEQMLKSANRYCDYIYVCVCVCVCVSDPKLLNM
jgi:hypothetical protein